MLIRFLLSAILAAVLIGAPAAAVEDLGLQRQLYRQARDALIEGDRETYTQLKRLLTDYPLYPYLIYAELDRRLSRADDAEVRRFIETYSELPPADLLHGAWLYELMRQGRWRTFLEAYNGGSDTALACYQLRARIRAGRLDGVAAAATEIWRVGWSQPEACDRLFAWLKQRDVLTPALLWERIDLAMEYGNPGLAGYLAERFSTEDAARVELWQGMYYDPAGGLRDPALEQDTLLTRKIILYGIKQLAGNDAELAKMLWEARRDRYGFCEEMRLTIDRDVALHSAYQQHPLALRWLHALPARAVDEDVHRWRARSALNITDWPALIDAIQAMAPAQRQEEEWRYWLARAQEKLDRSGEAAEIYTELAGERSYYGFLAADRVAAPYALDSQPVLDDSDTADALLEIPGVLRARELFWAGQVTDARREWNLVIDDLDREQLKRAAALAASWGWHPDAIRTVALAGHYDDLELRFPTPFEPDVLRIAEQRNLEPAWIYGVMRRESAFGELAVSSAGALGLMQVMPATGDYIAGRLGIAAPGYGDLLNGPYNIRLGSAYLREMLERFGGHRVLATAAYNAGPHRVDHWLPARGQVPADWWVDNIPFPETREYVRAVMAYTTIFERQLGLEPMRLSGRMRPVGPPNTVQTRTGDSSG